MVQRALREARRELAALTQATANTTPLSIVGTATAARQAAVRAESRGTHGEVKPPPWMKKLVLPDLPVYWNEALVRKLSDYRDIPQENAIIRNWIKRSGRYEAMILAKLRKAGLPEDLLFVAMIESAFDPAARSDAGAVGMWQFMEATAQDHGLLINRWVDQRLSPEHATDAAVDFLTELRDRLGSWPMVLAAYNMGPSGLQKAMRKYNSNDFWVLARLEAGLPYETVAYVAKATACAIVAKNLDAFKLTGLVKDADLGRTLVQVPGGTSLGRLALAAGMTASELAQLNPELHKPRLPPDVIEWDLRLPTEVAERFDQQWRICRPKRPPHRRHALRFGERLKDVAEAYDTTPQQLRLLNALTPDDVVRYGDTLTVPDVAPVLAKPEEKPIVGVPKRMFRYPGRRRLFYRALNGDRVSDIARVFKVTPNQVRRWNDLSDDAALIEGMYVQLFLPKDQGVEDAVTLSEDEVEVMIVGTEEFYDSYEKRRHRRRIRYRVKPGDSLATLAKQFGISEGSIARINQFSRYYDPPPHTEIILYVDADKLD